MHSAQSFFSLPWGQPLHVTQSYFTLPWGQGLHSTHLLFTLPCEHRFLSMVRDSTRLPRAAPTSYIANRAHGCVSAPNDYSSAFEISSNLTTDERRRGTRHRDPPMSTLTRVVTPHVTHASLATIALRCHEGRCLVRSRRHPRVSRRTRAPRCPTCDDEKNHYYVPPGAFGGITPERQASKMLGTMMTYIACWIVIDQTEAVAPRVSRQAGDTGAADGDGDRAAERITSTHDFLLHFLEANPIRDGDTFLAKLFSVNPDCGRRVAETRIAYASADFEWHNAKKVTLQTLAESNAKVQQRLLAKTFERSGGDDDDAIFGEGDKSPGSTKCFAMPEPFTTPGFVERAVEDWRRVSGRSVEYKNAFAKCSEQMRNRSTWVLKSLDGFVEFGLGSLDGTDFVSNLQSINKLGNDLRKAGVTDDDVALAEQGLLFAVRSELEANLGNQAWSDARAARWEAVLRTFMNELKSGTSKH